MDSSSMSTVWETVLAFIWRPENDGQDQDSAPTEGFLTRWGVTRMSWDFARHQEIVPDVPLEEATKDDLATVLRVNYWNAMQCDRFCNAGAPGLAVVLVNAAMMSGLGRATRILQQLAGTTVDGMLGPKTVAAALAKDHEQTITRFTDAYHSFLASLALWTTYGGGWGRRIQAAEMLAAQVQKQHA